MKKNMDIEKLRGRLEEISHFVSILGLLNWDQEVNMPPKAAYARAKSAAHLSALIHEKFVAIDDNKLLSNLKQAVDTQKIKGKDAVIVLETWRSFEREKKLPESFIREMAEVTSQAQNVWGIARKESNFKHFLPWLTKIIVLKRREAEYVGYKDSPYDALLDTFEPGMTAGDASKILNDLKDFLVPFLKRIKNSKVKSTAQHFKGKFPLDKQIAFNSLIATKLGFDFEAGRIDKSTHPFTSGFHPNDVRFTTRYREDNVLYSVGSTVHEVGHGLYEQGLPAEYFGTPLAESISVGIHESQSRVFENQIGKGKAFWKYFYPKLQKEFPLPFKKVSFEEFYKILNKVKPSLIRTEADEVTYNLHIIVRFEIEKEMIEGSIDPKDLPQIWKSKMKEYLGIDVPNDSLGVLQDVHWSGGMIGYFPTYTFGNLYAAQFYAAMEKSIPNLNKQIIQGEFNVMCDWLRTHIHATGKTYKAGELIKKVTGENLNSQYFADYLEKKYKEIYSL